MTPAEAVAILGPLPVVLPLLGAGLALTMTGRAAAQRLVSITVLTVVLAVAVVLLLLVDEAGAQSVVIGGWRPPLGIVLVVDRLSALLLVTSATVALAVLIYAVGQGMADGDDSEHRCRSSTRRT